MTEESRQGSFDISIANARGRVVEKGTENASPQDITLYGFGWIGVKLDTLTKAITDHTATLQNGNPGHNSSTREKVKKVGTPAVAGGGILVIVLEMLRVIFS